MAAPGAALAALILFCTLWRIPGLGDPPWLNDEGTYASVGRALVQGEALYREVWENKPPAIYLLYGAVHALVGPSHLLTGVRLAALLAATAVQVALFLLVLPLRGRGAALLAVAFAGPLLDLPLLEGTAANAEIFVVACTTAGMALLWRAMNSPPAAQAQREDRRGIFLPRRTPRRARAGTMAAEPRLVVAAGLAFGLAMLFKLVAATDLLAALLILAFHRPERPPLAAPQPKHSARIGEGSSPLAGLLAGAALPVGAACLWLGWQGLLGEALYATVGYNRGYVTSGQTLHAPILTVAGLAVLLTLGAAGAVLARRRTAGPDHDPAPLAAAACWWLALALLGALASGRSYPHYYLQAVPPGALCLTLLAGAAGARFAPRHPGRAQRLALATLLGLWACGVPLGSWLALHLEPPNAPPGSGLPAYYAHAWQHLTGALDDTAYGNSIDPRVERNLAVVRYLRQHPSSPRRLYIWGNTPWIYYLSGYEHAARFLSAYYLPPIPGGIESVLGVLRRDPPPYLVAIEPPLPASPVLGGLLRAAYRPVQRIGNAVIYTYRH